MLSVTYGVPSGAAQVVTPEAFEQSGVAAESENQQRERARNCRGARYWSA